LSKGKAEWECVNFIEQTINPEKDTQNLGIKQTRERSQSRLLTHCYLSSSLLLYSFIIGGPPLFKEESQNRQDSSPQYSVGSKQRYSLTFNIRGEQIAKLVRSVTEKKINDYKSTLNER
jgi:hypothetical protein